MRTLTRRLRRNARQMRARDERNNSENENDDDAFTYYDW
jgi:hypothetical protein